MQIPKFSNLIKYHVALGVFLNFIPQLFIVHIYLFFSVFFYLLVDAIANREKFTYYFTIGLLYFPLCESLGRLLSLDPFVPWEFGKYYGIFSVLFLIITKRMIWGWRSFIGIILITTTLVNGNTEWKLVFFNAITVYSIMLMGDFFGNIKLSIQKLLLLLRYSVLPLITFLFASLSKLKDINFGDEEFGSQFILDKIPANQIATYMGLGFFLMILLYKFKVPLGLKQWQNLIFAFGFFAIGIISFSRGGIIVGIIGIVALYFSNFRDLLRFKYFKQMIILLPIVILIGIFINNKTNGSLLLRYQGETKGTLVGGKEKNINTLTTNRFNIMIGDINTFQNNVLFGVETGRSLEYREEFGSQYSHIEYSRLLAEHGLVGLLVIILWLVDLVKLRSALIRSLYLIGFLTTFHSATRSSVPLVFMLISAISISTPTKEI